MRKVDKTYSQESQECGRMNMCEGLVLLFILGNVCFLGTFLVNHVAGLGPGVDGGTVLNEFRHFMINLRVDGDDFPIQIIETRSNST